MHLLFSHLWDIFIYRGNAAYCIWVSICSSFFVITQIIQVHLIYMMEIILIITVTTWTKVTRQNNDKMTSNGEKYRRSYIPVMIKLKLLSELIKKEFFLHLFWKKSLRLEVNSLNYFDDFTQATVSYSITIMTPNSSLFYLAIASRLEGHTGRGLCLRLESIQAKIQTIEACQVCLESVNCQIFHILQAKDSSQCCNCRKCWTRIVFHGQTENQSVFPLTF